MRLRTWTCWTVLALAAVAAPLRADDAKPVAPTLVVRLKSIDGILSDAKYIANLLGPEAEEHFKQFEGMVKSMAGPKGLASLGIDTRRPFGLYAVVTPAGVDSFAAVLIPVADEQAFVKFVTDTLGQFGGSVRKGGDDVYTVSHGNVPVEI